MPLSSSLPAVPPVVVSNLLNICRAKLTLIQYSSCSVSGHTGGPYDTVPEVVILLSLFAGPDGDKFVQTFYDEAGEYPSVMEASE